LLRPPFCRKKALMQISKSFLVVCAAACCVALQPLCAADADTEAKLREAMQKKLDELQTQPSAAAPKAPVAAPQPKKNVAPAPVPAPAVAPAPAPAPAPVVAPIPAAAPTVQSTPRPVLTAPPPVDSETIAKAREAMRQKMAEMETQAPSAAIAPAKPVVAAPAKPTPAVQPKPVVVAPAPAPAPAVKAAPVVAQPAPAPVVAPVPAPVTAPTAQAAPKAALVAPPAADSETLAKAREAMRKKMTELDAQPPVEASAVAPAAAAKPEAKPMAEKPAKKSTKVTGAQAFPPIQGPASTVPADKQARLAELLQKYRADQVTPEEYHAQRAKILAEP
jgi:hypothetical protein